MDPITIEASINASKEKVWQCWTESEHIREWCAASDDWHAPKAENDVREGGKFVTRMEAKDGSAGFDFSGVYTRVMPPDILEYTLDDGRKVSVVFSDTEAGTNVKETFEPEASNDLEFQRAGWQSILDNFKQYVEKK